MREERFAKFILSKLTDGTSSEQIHVFLCLYSDSVLKKTHTSALSAHSIISGLSISYLSEKTSISILGVERVIQELTIKNWIRRRKDGTFYLGDYIGESPYYLIFEELDEKIEKKVRPSNVIESLLRENKERHEEKKKLTEMKRIDAKKDMKRKTIIDSLSFHVPMGVSIEDEVTKILNRFKQMYRIRYTEDCPLISEGKANPHAVTKVYIKRAIEWSNSELVYKLVDFIFQNWAAIQEGLGLTGRPSFNVLGSSKLFTMLRGCMEEGIPKPRKTEGSVAKRFDPSKESKDTGW